MKKMTIDVKRDLNVAQELIALTFDRDFNEDICFFEVSNSEGVYRSFFYNGMTHFPMTVHYTRRPNWAWYKAMLNGLRDYCSIMESSYNLTISPERLFWAKLHELVRYNIIPKTLLSLIKTGYDKDECLVWFVPDFAKYVSPQYAAPRIRLGNSLYWVSNDSEDMPG